MQEFSVKKVVNKKKPVRDGGFRTPVPTLPLDLTLL